MFVKLATLALAVANLSSFAQTAQAPQPPATTESKALVYVYRYKQFVGSALAPSVYCDEAQLARMENGRYFLVRMEPGNHSFRSNDAQSGIALDLKAGQEYFIRVDIATGMLKGHGRLTLTAPEQGRYEVKSNKMKPLDSDKVVDKARVSVEEAKFEPAPVMAAAPAPQPQPKLQTLQAVGQDPPVREVTLSDEPAGTDPQTSLGEAARQAKQKKANVVSPQPQ
jgi:hypothetical protein